MKTIKGKITFGVILISIFMVIIVNVLIWNILHKNLEDFIINDMEKMKSIVEEQIIGHYSIGDKTINDTNKNDLWRILNKTNAQYDVFVSMDVYEGKNLWFVGEVLSDEYKSKIVEEANINASLMYIENREDSFIATYSYPIYIEENYEATLVFQKDYVENYRENLNLIKMIIGIQSMLFLVMIMFIYLWVKKSTDSLKSLSEGMEYISKGDYSQSLVCKSKDEIGLLIDNFNVMQDKINTQIDQLQREKDKSQELEKASREFFNYATHEMKTPIAAISGYTQILQEKNIDETTEQRAYERVLLECRRIESLVKNMLIVARKKENIQDEAEQFELYDVLNDVIQELQFYIDKERIKVNIDIASEKCSIISVKDEIRTVIKNLLDNALKYSKNKVVNITLKNKDEVEIIIENKAWVIPKEIRDKLFEPFTKYNYGNNKIASSGLGLFICKELIYKNGGSIECNTEEETLKFIIKFKQISKKV